MPKKTKIKTKKELLKTSEQWQKKFKKKILVLDPDGWDRQNFERSWKKEKIALAEFKRRCEKSTLKFLDKSF
jgi:hypothetical protein